MGIDDIYEICVGFLRREPSAALHLTFRDLDIMIKAERNRGQDMWDYTRHIMAAMGAWKGNFKQGMPLDRDKPEIDDALIDEARAFLDRMKQSKN